MRRLKAILFASTAFVAAAVGSAYAADQAVARRDPIVPVSHWDGLYASVSAGASWLKGDYSSLSATSSTSTRTTTNAAGVLTNSSIRNSSSADGFNTTGRDKQAVFTFTMGYNVVFGSWLLGIQSEVSQNFGKVQLQGGGAGTSSSITTRTFPLPAVITNLNSSSGISSNSNILHHDWTISEMAKIGFLVSQQWLLYGLIGGSYGGFSVDQGTSFNLSGVAWGGGVERDFGWLRAFLQVKTTNYREKDRFFPVSPGNTNSNGIPGVTSVNTNINTNGGGTTNRRSANENGASAGVSLRLSVLFV